MAKNKASRKNLLHLEALNVDELASKERFKVIGGCLNTTEKLILGLLVVGLGLCYWKRDWLFGRPAENDLSGQASNQPGSLIINKPLNSLPKSLTYCGQPILDSTGNAITTAGQFVDELKPTRSPILKSDYNSLSEASKNIRGEQVGSIVPPLITWPSVKAYALDMGRHLGGDIISYAKEHGVRIFIPKNLKIKGDPISYHNSVVNFNTESKKVVNERLAYRQNAVLQTPFTSKGSNYPKYAGYVYTLPAYNMVGDKGYTKELYKMMGFNKEKPNLLNSKHRAIFEKNVKNSDHILLRAMIDGALEKPDKPWKAYFVLRGAGVFAPNKECKEIVVNSLLSTIENVTIDLVNAKMDVYIADYGNNWGRNIAQRNATIEKKHGNKDFIKQVTGDLYGEHGILESIPDTNMFHVAFTNAGDIEQNGQNYLFCIDQPDFILKELETNGTYAAEEKQMVNLALPPIDVWTYINNNLVALGDPGFIHVKRINAKVSPYVVEYLTKI